MASTKASISKASKRPKINIIPPKQLFVDLTQDDTKTPSPKLQLSSPSAPNAPSKTPSTKDTSSSSIDYTPKSPTSSTSLSPNGYLNPPTSPPPRVSPPPLTQENISIDITLTLSPITPLDVQFDTPSPSPHIFGGTDDGLDCKTLLRRVSPSSVKPEIISTLAWQLFMVAAMGMYPLCSKFGQKTVIEPMVVIKGCYVVDVRLRSWFVIGMGRIDKGHLITVAALAGHLITVAALAELRNELKYVQSGVKMNEISCLKVRHVEHKIWETRTIPHRPKCEVRLSSPAVQQLWTLYPGKQTANLF
ncbi:hypothetical protein Tco_1485006 [Tanacetum coccineum]